MIRKLSAFTGLAACAALTLLPARAGSQLLRAEADGKKLYPIPGAPLPCRFTAGDIFSFFVDTTPDSVVNCKDFATSRSALARLRSILRDISGPVLRRAAHGGRLAISRLSCKDAFAAGLGYCSSMRTDFGAREEAVDAFTRCISCSGVAHTHEYGLYSRIAMAVALPNQPVATQNKWLRETINHCRSTDSAIAFIAYVHLWENYARQGDAARMEATEGYVLGHFRRFSECCGYQSIASLFAGP